MTLRHLPDESRMKTWMNCFAGQSGGPSDGRDSSSGPDGGDHDQRLLRDAGVLGRQSPDWRVRDEDRLVQNWVNGNIFNLHANQIATILKNTVCLTFVMFLTETLAAWTHTATYGLRVELKIWSSEGERTFTQQKLNSSCTHIPKWRRLRLAHTPGTLPKSHLTSCRRWRVFLIYFLLCWKYKTQ